MVQSWYNADGLYLKYGTDKATANNGGEYKTFGQLRSIEFKLDLTTLTSTPTIINDIEFMPKGVRIEQVDVVADAAATGTGATLDIGTIKTDRSTEIDYNGLIAALPLTSIDSTGEKTANNVGSTYAGALIGTTTGTDVGYFTANYNTAAYTAGSAFIRVFFNKP